MNLTTFRAFRSRNYRLYFSGQSISLIGTWMQRTAIYWVIYIQTHSSLMLGVTLFATQFPSFLFSLWGGVISDRHNRYRVLLITQIASMIQATLLTILFLLNHYTVWEILALSVLLGIINAFDVPARQSLVVSMVDYEEDLPNAIALNSSMVNLARLVGPAISGIVLAKLGAGICFMMNALSFLAVIISLLLMKLNMPAPQPRTKKIMGELNEGLSYLKATPAIGFVILFLACMSLLVLPYNTLLPVYAKVIFKGDASTFGYLNSFIGLGAIAGTFFLASMKSDVDLRIILFITSFIFGIGLVLFSHTTNLAIACACAIITGFGMMSTVTVSNTILQTTTSSEMRGRVISYFAMAFFGLQPLGGLLVGFLSNYIGTPDTILAEGIAAILIFGVFLFFMRKYIFRKKNEVGPEPEITTVEIE